MTFKLVHASYRFLFYILFLSNLQSALGFGLCFCSFALCFDPYLSTMPKKTRAHRTTSTSSESPIRVKLFKNDKCREAYDTLNCRRKIWSERAVVLDKLDPAIRANFESGGW